MANFLFLSNPCAYVATRVNQNQAYMRSISGLSASSYDVHERAAAVVSRPACRESKSEREREERECVYVRREKSKCERRGSKSVRERERRERVCVCEKREE